METAILRNRREFLVGRVAAKKARETDAHVPFIGKRFFQLLQVNGYDL
ncbi:hypothetical protein [Rubritalea tangerina]